MSTINTVLRKKANKQGLYPIAIRITKNRKSSFIYTGQYVALKDWDASKQRVKKSHANSTRLNNFINTKLIEANNSLLEIEQKPKKTAHVSDIKKAVVQQNTSQCFYDFAKTYFKDLEANKKFSRINSEQPIINRIKTYHHKKELPFEVITPLFLRGLMTHLRGKQDLSERSIANSLIFIRTLYNKAIQQGLIEQTYYPFGKGDDKIRIKIPPSVKIGLTAQEIKVIETLDLSDHPQQDHARCVFLFSFYMAGMRVADVLKMQWLQIQDGRIYYTMNKNQKTLSLKMNDKMNAILSPYKKQKKHNKGYIFPELTKANKSSTQDVLRVTKNATKSLNLYLGQIAKKAEIDKKLSMHIARHSFGNIAGDTIPIQMLQKLYRHSSITTTINYQQNFMHKETDDALDKVIGF